MAKILLVDDDPVLVKLYTTRLQSDKHEVKSSSNGEDGLKLLSTFNPNLIVLDLMMPKLNGFKFINSVRTNPSTAKIPILVFSSLANPQSAELKNQGVVGILNKVETTPSQLVQQINKFLGPQVEPSKPQTPPSNPPV